MTRRRKRLFAVGHNAADPIDYFGLPLEGTILMGSQIPIHRSATREARRFSAGYATRM